MASDKEGSVVLAEVLKKLCCRKFRRLATDLLATDLLPMDKGNAEIEGIALGKRASGNIDTRTNRNRCILSAVSIGMIDVTFCVE